MFLVAGVTCLAIGDGDVVVQVRHGEVVEVDGGALALDCDGWMFPQARHDAERVAAAHISIDGGRDGRGGRQRRAEHQGGLHGRVDAPVARGRHRLSLRDRLQLGGVQEVAGGRQHVRHVHQGASVGAGPHNLLAQHV